jgi:hypothetical protein
MEHRSSLSAIFLLLFAFPVGFFLLIYRLGTLAVEYFVVTTYSSGTIITGRTKAKVYTVTVWQHTEQALCLLEAIKNHVRRGGILQRLDEAGLVP